MNWQDRIEANPRILVGKPIIKGTRLAVEFILELLAERWTHEQILKSYPQLTDEDIWAVLQYASNSMNEIRADSQDDDEQTMRRAIEEHRQAAKAQVRREMGLSS